MRCSRIRKRLMAYHDGELTKAWSRRVDQHILSCAVCDKTLQGLEAADQGVAVPDPGSEYWDVFTARIMDRVKDDPLDLPAQIKPKASKRSFQVKRLAPAFSLALVVVVAAGLLMEIRGPIVPRQKMLTVQKQAVDADAVVNGAQSAGRDQSPAYSQYEKKAAPRMYDEIRQSETETAGDAVTVTGSMSREVIIPVPEETTRLRKSDAMEKKDRGQADEIASMDKAAIKGKNEEAEAASGIDEPAVSSSMEPQKAETLPAPAARPAPSRSEVLVLSEAALPDDDAPEPVTTQMKAQRKYRLAGEYNGTLEGDSAREPEAEFSDDRYEKETFRSMMFKAESLSREGRQADSEKILKDLLSQSPPSPIQEEATILLVKVLQYQDRIGEARRLLTEAQSVYPENEMVQQFRLDEAPADLKPSQ